MSATSFDEPSISREIKEHFKISLHSHCDYLIYHNVKKIHGMNFETLGLSLTHSGEYLLTLL